jgi:mono/diheme cytochrome c family protein
MTDQNTQQEHRLQTSTQRWMWAGLILMGLLAVAFPVYRVYEPGQRSEARDTQREFLAIEGSQLYQSQCSSCHGQAGIGALAPAIGSRDFLESVGDDQLTSLIGLGMPGTEMVGYSSDFGGPMTSSEIRSITVFLRSLEEESTPNPIWRTPLANQDFAGKDLYQLACAHCHGLDLLGIEDLGPDLSETSFALQESNEWLVDRVSNGFKEMPRFGGVLTEQQVNLIVAFLRGDTAPVVIAGPDDTVAPTTTAPEDDGAADAILALGMEVYNVTAGGVGCAKCHALDGQGTSDGPNILGSGKSAISGAMGGGIPDMEDVKLTAEQLEAVYRYLSSISP